MTVSMGNIGLYGFMFFIFMFMFSSNFRSDLMENSPFFEPFANLPRRGPSQKAPQNGIENGSWMETGTNHLTIFSKQRRKIESDGIPKEFFPPLRFGGKRRVFNPRLRKIPFLEDESIATGVKKSLSLRTVD